MTFALGQLDPLKHLDAAADDYATKFVEIVLVAARQAGASDVHLQPVANGLRVLWRLDGVLQPAGIYPHGKSADVVSRLKVLAELLTYRADIPQEGRIRQPQETVEMRVSTFPTLHGERAVVRFFAAQNEFLFLDDLGFPPDIPHRLRRLLAETSGAILLTGPAGSGKTTTIYACLRELVKATGGGRSMVSLEDPIEMAVDGVAQSQVNPPAGFTLASGLKSLLRQDPEVILVGEIRDRETAEVCMQASLTGQLVLTTFHAETTAGAIGRLSDMGIEPYLLRSGVLAILSQRLVRRLCPCSQPCADRDEWLGMNVPHARKPVGCSACGQTGYRGRQVLVELLEITPGSVAQGILDRHDVPRLYHRAVEQGMVPLVRRAWETVEAGLTSPAEIRRVLGFRHDLTETEIA